MIKLFFFTTLLLFKISPILSLQFSRDIEAVNIGSKISNLTLHVRQNGVVKILDFSKGLEKATIFDFWSTDCGTCIASMPEILKLQNKLGEKVQIIFVTSNSESDIQTVFYRLKSRLPSNVILAADQLPFVTDDTVVKKMFPHDVNPIEVWIDSDGFYKAVTYGNSLNYQNLRKFIKGANVDFDKYVYCAQTMDSIGKIFGNVDSIESLERYSVLRNYDARFRAIPELRIEDKMNGRLLGLGEFDKSILELYTRTCSSRGDLTEADGDTVLHTLFPFFDIDDSVRYSYIPPKGNTSEYLEWLRKNSFCYMIKVPSDVEGDFAKIMRRDLDSIFHLRSDFEIKKVRCLILRGTRKWTTPLPSNLQSISKLDYKKNTPYLLMENEPISGLCNRIYGEYLLSSREPCVFFNETGYHGNINIKLPWSSSAYKTSLARLRSSLRKYGLDLIEEYRNMNVLVVKVNRS